MAQHSHSLPPAFHHVQAVPVHRDQSVMENKDLVEVCILLGVGSRTQDELEHLEGHIQQGCMQAEVSTLRWVAVGTDWSQDSRPPDDIQEPRGEVAAHLAIKESKDLVNMILLVSIVLHHNLDGQPRVLLTL